MRGFSLSWRNQHAFVFAVWCVFAVLLILALVMFSKAPQLPTSIWDYSVGSRYVKTTLGYWSVSEAFLWVWVGLLIYAIPSIALTALWWRRRASPASNLLTMTFLAASAVLGTLMFDSSALNLIPQFFSFPHTSAAASLELGNSSVLCGIGLVVLAALAFGAGRLLTRILVEPARAVDP